MARILNVLFDERLGGPQLRAIQVAQQLRGFGFETRLTIPRGGDVLTTRLRADQIDYDELNLTRPRQTFHPLPHFRYAWHFWPNIISLRALIRRHSIQVVHTNGLMHLQAAIAARLEKASLVWHINDFVTPHLVSPVLVGFVRKWASRIAVASSAVGEFYFPGEDLGGRLKIVYPPVNTARFRPGLDGSRIRKEFNLPEDSVILGTVGNLTPLKGADLLLRSLPSIIGRFPKVRALIIGAKLKNRLAYHESLLKLSCDLGVSKHVIFTDQRNDIPRLMAAMTLYVHPARSEACGMAVLEASASGVPVVATCVGGVPETLIPGETGVMVPPEEPEALAKAVIDLLGSPDICRKMGRAGVEFCAQTFTLWHCVQRHLEIYRPLVETPVGKPNAKLRPQAREGT